MPKVRIDEIVSKLPKRNVSPHLVEELASSMSEIGLIHPITITPEKELVAGRQRLEAAKQLGWTEIEVTIMDADGFDEIDQTGIDETLVRQNYTALELAEALERRKSIHDARHPDRVKGSGKMMAAVALGLPISGNSFAEDIADKTDLSKRTVERLLQITNKIEPEVRDLLRYTPVANIITDLVLLSSLPAEERGRVAEMLNTGEAMRVAEAREKMRTAAPDPSSIVTDPERVAKQTASGPGSTIPSPATPIRGAASRHGGIVRIPPVVTAARRAVERAGVDPNAAPIRVERVERSPSDFEISVVLDPDNVDRATRAFGATARQVGEMTVARRAWYGVGSPAEPPADLPPPLSVDDIASLPVVPLEAEWITPDLVVIKRAGLPVIYLPVERATRSTIIKPEGNLKTDGEIVIANMVSNGCFRSITGHERSHLPCYADESGQGGCYANYSRWARRHPDYNVIENGLTNSHFKLRLPKDGRGELSHLLDARDDGRPHIARVDSETADGSMSIALGVMQSLAEINPDIHFTTIASSYFRPSDAMLVWLAALPNTWVGATVSGWFGPAETEARFAAIERLLSFGVQTTIWVATHPDWENRDILRRARQLVADDRIIETPHRVGNHQQRLPLLGVNPYGACGDHRYDDAGRPVVVLEGGPGDVPQYAVVGEDGTYETPTGGVHARCRDCGLKCGFNQLFGQAEADAIEAAA